MKKILRQSWSLLTLVFISCGIEDYIFLNPVPAGNITTEFNSRATIRLPAIDLQEDPYFTHFTIYYRIYISDFPSSGKIDTGSFNTLNSALLSDYNTFLPYINNTTTNVNTSIGTLFKNRNYQALAVEGANIETEVLDKTALGKELILNFSQTPGSIPSLHIDNDDYSLQRSNSNNLFTIVPGNKHFLNTSELNRTTVSNTVNTDVAAKEVTGSRYTYASMYIVVTGIDSNFSPIYSAPTFIGVLRLPEP